jgi:hypothetical protein
MKNKSELKEKTHITEMDAKAISEAALFLMKSVLDYFREQKITINEIIFVPSAIMSRILQTHDAIALLLKNGHHSEAAVLSLTQFELRFDLLYVSSDIKNATAWVEHSDHRTLNIGMRAKLKKLVPREADRLYETFSYLSGIKHGNPLYSELAFPGRSRAPRVVFATGPIDDKFSKTFADKLLAYSTYQVAWAAQVINLLISKYAIIEHERRTQAHRNYIKVKHVESDFLRFLRRKISSRKTFFGIKSNLNRRQKGRSNPSLK